MFFSRKDFCQSCLKNKGRQVLINWKKKSKCHLLNQAVAYTDSLFLHDRLW